MRKESSNAPCTYSVPGTVLTTLYELFHSSLQTTLYISLLSTRESKWRRQWPPTPILLPGKPHGRRSLVGCSPWGLEEFPAWLCRNTGEGQSDPPTSVADQDSSLGCSGPGDAQASWGVSTPGQGWYPYIPTPSLSSSDGIKMITEFQS